MIQNVIILGLVGLLFVAVAVPLMVTAATRMRMPSLVALATFVVGDLLFTSAAAAIVCKYLLG